MHKIDSLRLSDGNSVSQKIPICQACASPAPREVAEEESDAAPLEEIAGVQGESINGPPEEGSLNVELRDPYLNPLEEIVLDTGSLPCAIHGYDHLSRDPTCEFCKRALGPLCRHLSKKYGQSLGDHTPTLSFDFSGPHPVAVTGARFMLLFVWRLDTVRLLWAFAVAEKTKECVRCCLNDVVAELNTYTGGSKPPVMRIHSDQAREFLSQPVMEWLMHHNIKQTFTSTGDPSANGVAERWIDLVKVKATALLASRYLPTTSVLLCCSLGSIRVQSENLRPDTKEVFSKVVNCCYCALSGTTNFKTVQNWES